MINPTNSMKTKVLLYSLLFFLLLSCNNSRKSKESSSLQITSISIPENLNISTPIDSLFSEIKLLPLETKQGYEIADIFHFIVYDSLIIINDDRKRLLIFNNNGKLIRQIGRQGEGPGEYLSLRDFYVNDQKEIEILDFKKIERYTLDGQHISTSRFDLLDKYECNPSNFCAAPSGGYFLWGGTLGIKDASPKRSMLYRVNSSIQITEGYFPITHPAGGALYRFSTYKNLILIEPIFGDYYIYQIDSLGKVSPRYQYDFGKKKYHGKLDFSKNMSPDEINQINESVIQMINFQETDQWLHVDFGFKGKVYSSFYCKEKAKTYLTNANAIQKNPEEFCFWWARQTYKNTLINPVEASWICEELNRLSPQAIKKWKLEAYRDIKEDDNPVLVFYKFK